VIVKQPFNGPDTTAAPESAQLSAWALDGMRLQKAYGRLTESTCSMMRLKLRKEKGRSVSKRDKSRGGFIQLCEKRECQLLRTQAGSRSNRMDVERAHAERLRPISDWTRATRKGRREKWGYCATVQHLKGWKLRGQLEARAVSKTPSAQSREGRPANFR
jgi:hypothetical protein